MLQTFAMKIITADLLVSMIPDEKPLKKAGIAYANGIIAKVGSVSELEELFPKAEKEHHNDAVLMPGLVNAYSHPELASVREAGFMPTDAIGLEILMIEQKDSIQPKDASKSASEELSRWLRAGTTSVGITSQFAGTYRVAKKSGMRVVVMPEITGGNSDLSQDVFESALALVEEHLDDGLVSSGLAPSAPYLLSRPMLKLTAEHAKRSSIPLHIRAAFSFAEMEFFFDSQGSIANNLFPKLGWDKLPPAHRQTPVNFLSEIGVFTAQTSIVGGTQLAGKDFPLLSRNGVRVIWCPRLLNICKSGKFPWKKLSSHGIPIAFGVEDFAIPEGDLWQEMRTAQDPENVEGAPSSHDLLYAATMGGARALRLENCVGSLEEGKKADYVVVAKPANENVFDGLVSETSSTSIKKIAIDGKDVTVNQ